MDDKEPPVSASPKRTSLLARLQTIESNLAMLGTVYRHWDESEMYQLKTVETSLEHSCKASEAKRGAMYEKKTSANRANNSWHRNFV